MCEVLSVMQQQRKGLKAVLGSGTAGRIVPRGGKWMLMAVPGTSIALARRQRWARPSGAEIRG